MEVLDNIKKLYCGKYTFLNHISLFSLAGIMAIAFYSYLSSVFGNIYGSFLEAGNLSPVQSYLALVISTMLLIFFTGYSCNFINKMFKEECGLPELSLSSYSVFLKSLPVFSVWIFYFFVAAFLGFAFLSITSYPFYIYFSVLICLIPFGNIISVIFCRDFSYKSKFFNPLFIFKVLNKSLGAVISLTAQTLIVSAIPVIISYFISKYTAVAPAKTMQLVYKLLAICFWVYFVMIIQYIYNMGLVNIVKNKIISE